jgi:hypothetical protein
MKSGYVMMTRALPFSRLLAVLTLSLLSVVMVNPRAEAATSVETIPFEGVLDACGETITLSGNLRVISTTQPLGDGGYLVAAHFQPQGIRGTSASGAMYRATGLTRDLTVLAPSGGSTFTYINRFHIVGTAGAPTYSVTETLHLTVTASGQVTAQVDHFNVACR